MFVLEWEGNPKLAFVLPPKTGSRSVVSAIESLGATYRVSRHGVDISELASADITATTIRNPFDVLVSWYHYDVGRARRCKDFSDWLRRASEGLEYITQQVLPFATYADYFIRYEDGLEKGLNYFLTHAGYPEVTVPHRGAAKNRRPYREYYNKQDVEFVYEQWGVECSLYGYKF